MGSPVGVPPPTAPLGPPIQRPLDPYTGCYTPVYHGLYPYTGPLDLYTDPWALYPWAPIPLYRALHLYYQVQADGLGARRAHHPAGAPSRSGRRRPVLLCLP